MNCLSNQSLVAVGIIVVIVILFFGIMYLTKYMVKKEMRRVFKRMRHAQKKQPDHVQPKVDTPRYEENRHDDANILHNDTQNDIDSYVDPLNNQNQMD